MWLIKHVLPNGTKTLPEPALADLSSKGIDGIHMWEIWQDVLKKKVRNIS